MPLVQGCSRGAVSENIKREMRSGRPRDQAIAIALQVAWDNRGKCSLSRRRELAASRTRAGVQ